MAGSTHRGGRTLWLPSVTSGGHASPCTAPLPEQDPSLPSWEPPFPTGERGRFPDHAQRPPRPPPHEMEPPPHSPPTRATPFPSASPLYLPRMGSLSQHMLSSGGTFRMVPPLSAPPSPLFGGALASLPEQRGADRAPDVCSEGGGRKDARRIGERGVFKLPWRVPPHLAV